MSYIGVGVDLVLLIFLVVVGAIGVLEDARSSILCEYSNIFFLRKHSFHKHALFFDFELVFRSSHRDGSTSGRSGRRDRSHRRDYRSRGGESHHRNRSNSPSSSRRVRPKLKSELPMEPIVGKIFPGRVTSVLAFGAIVQLEGLQKRWEGLVHVSQLRREGRVTSVTDVVQRHQKVYVKVLSFTGTRTSLSMREVNQETGEDLNPSSASMATSGMKSHDEASRLEGSSGMNDDADDIGVRNPDRPFEESSSIMGLRREVLEDDGPKRKIQRISSPERWELKQMISAGVIDKSELPEFDEETGLLPKEDEESDEDIEIELVEEEPPFLKVTLIVISIYIY